MAVSTGPLLCCARLYTRQPRCQEASNITAREVMGLQARNETAAGRTTWRLRACSSHPVRCAALGLPGSGPPVAGSGHASASRSEAVGSFSVRVIAEADDAALQYTVAARARGERASAASRSV
eukprot:scaffold30993_cov242-Isochrysis_galbana.AAC.3